MTTEAAPTDLTTAATELSDAVYTATGALEDLEHAGLVRGNAHHMRQEVAKFAADLLRERWTGDR